MRWPLLGLRHVYIRGRLRLAYLLPEASSQTKRKTGWKKADKRRPGIYKRSRAKGFEYGYYDAQLGRIVGGQPSKEAAEEPR
jgi:hypothetical protein